MAGHESSTWLWGPPSGLHGFPGHILVGGERDVLADVLADALLPVGHGGGFIP